MNGVRLATGRWPGQVCSRIPTPSHMRLGPWISIATAEAGRSDAALQDGGDVSLVGLVTGFRRARTQALNRDISLMTISCEMNPP